MNPIKKILGKDVSKNKVSVPHRYIYHRGKGYKCPECKLYHRHFIETSDEHIKPWNIICLSCARKREEIQNKYSNKSKIN